MKIFSFLVIQFLCISLYAQEICNNCIDDDNDGLIDCYDPECRNDTNFCSNFYLGATIETDTLNRCTENFQLIEKWRLPGNYGTRTFTIGDLDNDGMSELIVNGSVYDGETGFFIKSFPSFVGLPVVFADVDKDGVAELFTRSTLATLVRYEYDGPGTATWSSACNVLGYFSIADFDGNDTAEIFVKAAIYSTINGNLIANADSIIINPLFGNSNALSIAADVLPDNYCANCSGLELIQSRNIFSVDISTGIIKLENSGPSIMLEGQIAVADMNMDGLLDVIVNSKDAIYVYDPRSGGFIGSPYFYTSNAGGDLPIVGNFDLDPEPEIGISNNKDKVFVLDNDMTLLWENYSIKDPSGSGGEAFTLFDLNCDGIAELIHRGGDGHLDIVRGSDGMILAQDTCLSATGQEQSIVADINNDGHADIICGCNDGLKVWTGAGPNYWAPSRKVWNQFTYFNMHINDDLTVPCKQQSHANSTLPNKLNSFYAQAPLFDNQGESCWPNPRLQDMALQIDTVVYKNCDSVIVLFSICNTSQDSIVPVGVPYTIYIDTIDEWKLLSQGTVTSPIQPGNCVSYSVILKASNNIIRMYINDDGTDIKNPPTTSYIYECFLENNQGTVHIQKINSPVFNLGPDQVTCLDTSIILNGPQYTGIDYLWSTGSVGASITIKDTGLYHLSATSYGVCSYSDSVNIILAEDCYLKFFIPNVISANEDGINDELKVSVTGKYSFFSLKVFDRFGKMVFNSNKPNESWKGSYTHFFKTNSNIIYTYILELDNIKELGNITLIY